MLHVKTTLHLKSLKMRAYQYTVLRNILYRKEYPVEILVNYEPSLQYFGEWWKQLASEIRR